MTPRLVLEPEAELDLAEAQAWYDEHAPGIGSAFLDEVGETLEAIEEAPQRFHFNRDDVRVALVRRFPYVVLFVELPDVISVIGIIHTSRDPTIWHLRADV